MRRRCSVCLRAFDNPLYSSSARAILHSARRQSSMARPHLSCLHGAAPQPIERGTLLGRTRQQHSYHCLPYVRDTLCCAPRCSRSTRGRTGVSNGPIRAHSGVLLWQAKHLVRPAALAFRPSMPKRYTAATGWWIVASHQARIMSMSASRARQRINVYTAEGVAINHVGAHRCPRRSACPSPVGADLVLGTAKSTSWMVGHPADKLRHRMHATRRAKEVRSQEEPIISWLVVHVTTCNTKSRRDLHFSLDYVMMNMRRNLVGSTTCTHNDCFISAPIDLHSFRPSASLEEKF